MPERGGGLRIPFPETSALPTSQFPGRTLHLERALPPFAVQSVSILKGPRGRLPPPAVFPAAGCSPRPLSPAAPLGASGDRGRR